MTFNHLTFPLPQNDPFQGTGLVSAAELKHLLMSVGNLLNADEAYVVDRFKNKDGMVKYELLVSELIHG